MVLEQPDTRYARSGELSIGYQVLGDGPLDLVFVPGLLSQIDFLWTVPAATRFFERLVSFSRLILFDKRGQGVSDPPRGVHMVEHDMADLRAVLDAAGSERAALFGFSEGGPMSALFAATHPERVTHLILFGTYARGADFYNDEAALRSGIRIKRMDDALAHWGEGRSLEIFAPSVVSQENTRRFGLFERAVGSPTVIRERFRTAVELDVTEVLHTLRVPTLVLQRGNEKAVPATAARAMAEEIDGARYVELAGEDHIPWVGDAEPVLEEVEEFLTGVRRASESDRVLATVMFTDIVDSTRLAAEAGDRRWRDLAESHDEIVREALATYRGNEVKTLGDGFLATFDGPGRAIACAAAIVRRVRTLGLEVRAGLHTGECEVANDDVRGIAVNLGARVGAMAGPGEILVTSTVKDLVAGSGIPFEDRGMHHLKGVPDEWRLFRALPGQA